MLYISLVVSAILLFWVNRIAWKAERPVGQILVAAFVLGGFSLGPCLVQLPPVILQAILVGIAALIWGARHGRPQQFLVLSCAATLAAFAIPGYFAFQQTKHLQEVFPYISMDERLPARKKERLAGNLSVIAAKQLAEMETVMDDKERSWPNRIRGQTLRQIHEETVRIFLEQPGFGVTRMVRVSEQRLKRGAHDEPPIAQPGVPSASPWQPDELRKKPFGALLADAPSSLFSLHRDSVADFANPAGFGYIKDRQHAAGFQEHQVSHPPTLAQPWKLQTLDLIGLVMHEKPIAYVSENLPRMQELKSAPTRSLDEFESAGLPSLERGEDLFVRERGQERRILGAIRAARQCLACHDAERGDLLGAFSYRMTLDGK